ncbi:HPr family phosphocarrier protein [symbiont of Argiope bruennichi]
MKKTVKIIDKIGLHARPVAKIVNEASKYKSSMFLNYNGRKGNLKSILNIISLGVKSNSEVELIFDGDDAELASKQIIETMKNIKLI